MPREGRGKKEERRTESEAGRLCGRTALPGPGAEGSGCRPCRARGRGMETPPPGAVARLSAGPSPTHPPPLHPSPVPLRNPRRPRALKALLMARGAGRGPRPRRAAGASSDVAPVCPPPGLRRRTGSTAGRTAASAGGRARGASARPPPPPSSCEAGTVARGAERPVQLQRPGRPPPLHANQRPLTAALWPAAGAPLPQPPAFRRGR